MARLPEKRRDFVPEGLELGSCGEPVSNFSDMVFGFVNDTMENFRDRKEESEEEEEEEEEERDKSCSIEENKNFWENQNQLLEATLCRSSSLESRIRNATKEAIKEVQQRTAENGCCVCPRPVIGGCCRNCLMREVSALLRNTGYNCAICKTKWKSSPDIPSGEHTFLDVVENSSSKRGNTRVIIELNFRAEFEMARASEEYNGLIKRLPKVFVGKVEKLETLIKILSSAAKKCTKERKMHMGPWRKQRYMQTKWISSACERTTAQSTVPITLTEYSGRLAKPKASMLTMDLLEKLSTAQHRTAVVV